MEPVGPRVPWKVQQKEKEIVEIDEATRPRADRFFL